MEIETSLKQLGLSPQEVSAYINTLKLGISKASEIAKKSGMRRSACYYTLSLLGGRGLISEVIKSGVKYYSAVPPERLLEIIKEDSDKKSQAIKEVIDNLKQLQATSIKKPKVEFYEGDEGFKTIVSLLTKTKKTELLTYFPNSILKYFPLFGAIFRRKRKEQKIFLRAISEDIKEIREIKKDDKKELRKIRFNDSIIKGLDSAMYIMPRSVIILKANEKEKIGISIEEETIAKMQKQIFEQIWSNSKPKF